MFEIRGVERVDCNVTAGEKNSALEMIGSMTKSGNFDDNTYG